MKTTLLSTMLTLATAGLLGQTTIFVKTNATGDGTSWANASDLETAVTRATSGAHVWVQAGTYYPKTMLTVADGVALYGGFEGTELSLLQRDLTDKTTIIDAQKKYGSVVRLGVSATLNGFTIQNGDAQHNPHRNGGGVWADDNATIENCLIINNTAMLNGGGLYSKGPTKIINTTISDNTARGSGDNMCGNCTTIISEGNSSGFSELTYNEITMHDTLVVRDTIIIHDTISDPSGTLTATSTIAIVTHPSATAQTKGMGETFPSLSVSATSEETLSYQWYYSTNNSNTGGTLIAGATGSSYTPSSTTGSTLYYYCVVSNSYGSVVSNVSGAHRTTEKSCNFDAPNWGNSLGTVGFASTTERTISGNGITQTWSDAVTATVCQKATFNGGSQGNLDSDCRSNPNYPGDFFTWCAVVRYQDQLCPSPWRVPTKQDFINLDKAMGGTGENRTVAAQAVWYSGTGSNQWGVSYGGSCETNGNLINQGSYANCWTAMEDSSTSGYSINLNSSGYINPQNVNTKLYGRTLRCVR